MSLQKKRICLQILLLSMLTACASAASVEPTATRLSPSVTPVPLTLTPEPTETAPAEPTLETSPTSTPEIPVSPDSVFGFWKGSGTVRNGDNFFIFRDDGTWAFVTYVGLRVDESIFDEARHYGTYTIEGLELILLADEQAFNCPGQAGSYHVFLKDDGLIYFKHIEDSCSTRLRLFGLGQFEPVD